jgi:hypothetical protein
VLGICGKALRTFGDNRIGDSGWILARIGEELSTQHAEELATHKKRLHDICTLAAMWSRGGGIVKRKVYTIMGTVPIQFNQIEPTPIVWSS